MQVLITAITAAVTVLGESGTVGERESREQAGGLWYVRNAAKANRKPHTPGSNEINASRFSGARGKSDRWAQSTDETDCEGRLIRLSTELQLNLNRAESWTGPLVQPKCLLAGQAWEWETERVNTGRAGRGTWGMGHKSDLHPHNEHRLRAVGWWMMPACLLLQN